MLRTSYFPIAELGFPDLGLETIRELHLPSLGLLSLTPVRALLGQSAYFKRFYGGWGGEAVLTKKGWDLAFMLYYNDPAMPALIESYFHIGKVDPLPVEVSVAGGSSYSGRGVITDIQGTLDKGAFSCNDKPATGSKYSVITLQGVGGLTFGKLTTLDTTEHSG